MVANVKLLIKKVKHFRLLGPMRSALTAPPVWAPWVISLDGDTLSMEGHAFPPSGAGPDSTFSVNSRRFESVENGVPSGEAGKRYFFIKGSDRCGFRCSTTLSPEDRGGKEHLVLQYLDSEKGRPYSERSNYYYPLHDTMPVPSPASRIRVHGNDSADHFLLEGYSTFQKMDKAVLEHAHAGLASFPRILDWGCGCGRVGRYFGRLPGISYTGIDIDGDNIAWCREHLPFGEFQQVPLHPPTALPAASFDLLFGISIFTHLKEKEQFEWLGELNRLAAPGAMVLMTTHGEVAAARAGLNIFRKHRKSAGIMDLGSDPSLKGYIDDDDYYRSTFHTHDYIRTKWSRYFEVVAIIPGYIGNNQDLVVMRKTLEK